jgi:hypothetical protein
MLPPVNTALSFSPVTVLVRPVTHLLTDNILWDVRPVAQIPVNPEDAKATVVAVPVAVTGLMFMTGWQTCLSVTLKVPAGSLKLASTRAAEKNFSETIPFSFL